MKAMSKQDGVTCVSFFESYMEDWFSTYADESVWSDDFSTEVCLKHMQDLAKEKGVTLNDLEEWNYDKFFYETYKCTEKGLS